jgi:predicted phage terminase large subunit-like protein
MLAKALAEYRRRETRRECKASLHAFIRRAWPLVEHRPLISGWHIEAISEHLEAISRGALKRLIINIPPRCMKSYQACVMWPCWEWTNRPETQFLFASYAATLSIRDNTRARRVLESPWYQDHFALTLTDDQNQKIRYDNTAGGYRIATSVGGALTGDGGDVIVIDDPISADDVRSETKRDNVLSWFDETMRSRLNDPKTGAFVVIMQRLHENDLTGHLLANDTGWDHLCLPARFEPDHPTPVKSSIGFKDPRTKDGELLWPERFGPAELAEIAPPGSYVEAGQLQQRPAPREGGLFKRDAFKVIPQALPCKTIVRRWDLASTDGDGDYTAGVKLGERLDGEGYIVLDVQRFQKGPGEVRRLIKATAEADRAQHGESVKLIFPQDPAQAGKDQKNSYATEFAVFGPRFERESGDKEVRADPFAAQVEIGRVSIVRADWNEPFLNEMASFPKAQHDDQVDAASGAFNAIARAGPGFEWNVGGRVISASQ